MSFFVFLPAVPPHTLPPAPARRTPAPAHSMSHRRTRTGLCPGAGLVPPALTFRRKAATASHQPAPPYQPAARTSPLHRPAPAAPLPPAPARRAPAPAHSMSHRRTRTGLCPGAGLRTPGMTFRRKAATASHQPAPPYRLTHCPPHQPAAPLRRHIACLTAAPAPAFVPAQGWYPRHDFPAQSGNGFPPACTAVSARRRTSPLHRPAPADAPCPPHHQPAAPLRRHMACLTAAPAPAFVPAQGSYPRHDFPAQSGNGFPPACTAVPPH